MTTAAVPFLGFPFKGPCTSALRRLAVREGARWVAIVDCEGAGEAYPLAPDGSYDDRRPSYVFAADPSEPGRWVESFHATPAAGWRAC